MPQKSPPREKGRLSTAAALICATSTDDFGGLRRPVLRNRRDLYVIGSLDPELLSQFRIDPSEDVLVVLQEIANVLTALPYALKLKAVPCE